MEIRKFYETIGSDYKDVEKRMGSEKLVMHFVGRFMQDKTFASLSEAMEKNDGEAAFRAAHTLKGVCSNLGFDRLREASSELTEALRHGSIDGSEALFAIVKKEYEKVIGAWEG